MIEICGIDKTDRGNEVAFRWKGIDMTAMLDPKYPYPVIVNGSAEGCEVDVKFGDYGRLQIDVDEYCTRQRMEATAKKLVKQEREYQASQRRRR